MEKKRPLASGVSRATLEAALVADDESKKNKNPRHEICSEEGSKEQKAPPKEEQHDVFECDICSLHMPPPFRQCTNGHLLCNDCLPKLKDSCPQCRVSLKTMAVSLLALELAQSHPRACTHSGCEFVGDYLVVVAHERACAQRAIACPFTEERFRRWARAEGSGQGLNFDDVPTTADCQRNMKPDCLYNHLAASHVLTADGGGGIVLNAKWNTDRKASRFSSIFMAHGHPYWMLAFVLKNADCLVAVFKLEQDSRSGSFCLQIGDRKHGKFVYSWIVDADDKRTAWYGCIGMASVFARFHPEEIAAHVGMDGIFTIRIFEQMEK